MRLQWRRLVWKVLYSAHRFHALALEIQDARHGVSASKYLDSSPHVASYRVRGLPDLGYRKEGVTRHPALWCIVLERPLEVASLVSA